MKPPAPEPPRSMPPPCAACRVQRGGFGSLAEHPPPAEWGSVASLGPAWTRSLSQVYVCARCARVHWIVDNHRDGTTDVHRLSAACAAWFGPADPIDAVVDTWLTETPLANATLQVGLDVLRAFRDEQPTASTAHGAALLAALAEPTLDPGRARALLGAVAALPEPPALGSADRLLASHRIADRLWLPTLSRLSRARPLVRLPPQEARRLAEATRPEAVLAGTLARLHAAAERQDWGQLDDEAAPAWMLLAEGARPEPDQCAAVEALARRVAALPSDRVIEHHGFGDSTPQSLSERLARLAENCRYHSAR